MKRTSLAIFTAMVCASAPFAIGLASAQQPGAASPSGQLDRFVGDGTCTGNVMAMDKQPGHATVGKFHGEKILDGHWVVIHYDEDKTAANPKPFSVVQYIGYDKAKKQFVAVAFDNSGAPYSMGTSQGPTRLPHARALQRLKSSRRCRWCKTPLRLISQSTRMAMPHWPISSRRRTLSILRPRRRLPRFENAWPSSWLS